MAQFKKRDSLRLIESEIQAAWEEHKVFEAEVDASKEHYLVTFPYPYMNGRLHLGHAFTMLKADYMTAYQRLLGKNVLFPYAFHCTGMPIQGAATKLQIEMQKYGVPPVAAAVEQTIEGEDETVVKQLDKFKGAKGKLAKKTGSAKLQWDILKMVGIPDDEIPRFADPVYWLNYFPRLGEQDLKKLGLHVDWRRSFITTSENQYYDKFIRWQFQKLRDADKVAFGRRPTVYSPLDKQACADHDRSVGEGVGPQEYTLIKIQMLELKPDTVAQNPELARQVEAGKAFLVAATLRPETMYGQTNCFLLPDGEYGAFEIPSTGEVFICSHRSARNMSYQDPFVATQGDIRCIATVTGRELIGLPVKAPKTSYDKVYTLPLLTISMNKGTGVVTSVPSDAPDDYAALRDWQNDGKLRNKYGITEEMVASYQVIPIIEIPGMGNTCAVYMCDKLKIKSQNDSKKLADAKAETYKKGFYEGVMIVGEEDGVKGLKVCDAKDMVKNIMIKDGEAMVYYEPEKEVVSRSGDSCVVSYLDQWFIKYGEEKWRDEVLAHVTDPTKFTGYTDATRHEFVSILHWLKEWACSRSFGLGTNLPWDEQFVIESLSDSTIYMAYYTISHLLQGRSSPDDYIGNEGASPLDIKPEQLTNEAFDYIFLKKSYPAGCEIEQSKLDILRESFEYWYPVNLRVSGKDLVRNHLTMCLYNHNAVWNDRPDLMPKSFFVNGHVQVENKKMSKSEGNFIMLDESVVGHREIMMDGKAITVGWTTDATRLALGCSGDGLEDANFSCEVADKSILRLCLEIDFANAVIAETNLRTGDDLHFFDRVFNAQIDTCIENTKSAYDNMRYADVCKFGFFELLNYRDAYQNACKISDLSLHKTLVHRFLETFSIIMSPIVPHVCEKIWRDVLRKDGFLAKVGRWPVVSAGTDFALVRAAAYMNDTIRAARLKIIKSKIPATCVTLYVTNEYPEWKQKVLNFLAQQYDKASNSLPEKILAQVRTFAASDPMLKPLTQQVMQASAYAKSRLEDEGAAAFELTVPYDQEAVLLENIDYVKSSMCVTELKIEHVETEGALPGKPHIVAH